MLVLLPWFTAKYAGCGRSRWHLWFSYFPHTSFHVAPSVQSSEKGREIWRTRPYQQETNLLPADRWYACSVQRGHGIYQSVLFIEKTHNLCKNTWLQQSPLSLSSGRGQGLTVAEGQAPSCYFFQAHFPIPKDEPSGQQAVDQQHLSCSRVNGNEAKLMNSLPSWVGMLQKGKTMCQDWWAQPCWPSNCPTCMTCPQDRHSPVQSPPRR